MFDWTTLLTSSVISATLSGIIGVLIKGKLDKKLEKNKQKFEIEKMGYLVQTQKDIESLKAKYNQLNTLIQNNLDFFHSINKEVQNKRINAIENVWKEYLNIRIKVSPIINLFSVTLPKEYLRIINDSERSNKFHLNSINEIQLPKGLDTVPYLYVLELQRPFLNEVLYFKFRSSIIVLLRLLVMYYDMVKRNEIYYWNKDELLLSHFTVVFSSDVLTEGEIPINIDDPLKLLQLIGIMELELNKSTECYISGEINADLSFERAKKLIQGYK